VRGLLAGGVALVAAGGAWPLLVALTPASSRPWISGTSDNSIWSLITDYNGLGRLDGQAGGPQGMGGGGGGFGGGGGGGGGGAGGLKMVGGTQSLDELIASTERGVLVTRNWYIRALDPRTASYTGLTRDGTFLVENGKVSKSIKNFRWNESPLLMLDRILAIGRAERVSAGTVMPSLKIADFNFSSISEAV